MCCSLIAQHIDKWLLNLQLLEQYFLKSSYLSLVSSLVSLVSGVVSLVSGVVSLVSGVVINFQVLSRLPMANAADVENIHSQLPRRVNIQTTLETSEYSNHTRNE